MIVWTNDPHCVTKALRVVNKRYQGNIKALDYELKEQVRYPDTFKIWKLRISVQNARAPGGRRRARNLDHAVHAACWHAYRDFISALFDFGARRVKTMQADYKSKDAFEELFLATGLTNIGSAFNPVQYREACDCALTWTSP